MHSPIATTSLSTPGCSLVRFVFGKHAFGAILCDSHSGRTHFEVIPHNVERDLHLLNLQRSEVCSERKPVCAHRISWGVKHVITARWKTEVLFRIARLYVGSKIVCFYESDHAFKTIWRRPCLCHLIKIKGYFLKPGRPVFIIVINTSCSGVCLPNGALALFVIFARHISCNKHPHNRYLFLQSSITFVLQYTQWRYR